MISYRSYGQALRRLLGLSRFGMRPGLSRLARVLDKLGAPQQTFVSLHVAGTNGKGSTSAFLAASFRVAGYRTGLYTSPHLCRFSERIQVDGREIPEAAVMAALDPLLQLEPELTFFETATALAFKHFADEGVQVAVVEAGLGGALDATNIIQPRVSLLTRIDLDHLEVIGPDLRSVAREKAGIIKPRVPVVSAPAQPVVVDELERRCAEVDAPLLLGGRDFSWRCDPKGLLVERPHPGDSRRGLELSLAGEHQWENAALAITALDEAAASGLSVPEAALRRGLNETRWPGRLESLGEVLLDGAHNASGARALAAYLARQGCRYTIIVGLLGPKQPEDVIVPLRPHARRFLLTRPRGPRALDPALLQQHTGEVPAELCRDLTTALARARKEQSPILITGSLYLVGEARALLLGEPVDPVATADPIQP